MRYFFLTIILIGFGGFSFAQSTMADAFNKDKRIVWFGLDFSQAKMVGSSGFNDPYKIVNYYFTNWNELVNTEGEKYDVRKVMHRRDMEYVLEPVRKKNEDVDSGELRQGHLNKVSEEQVRKAIKAFDLKNQDPGIGMCMVVENFDKAEEKGNFYIVFFDIATKDVVHMEKCSGPASGFGFRNYWARSFKGILDKIESRYYRKWRKSSEK